MNEIQIVTQSRASDFTEFHYQSLAIGDYVLGRTDLPTAARKAAVDGAQIVGAVRACADGAADDASPAPILSIVVPVFNNASTLRELHDRLVRVLKEIGPSELVFVDDGSSDESADVLRELADDDDDVRVLRLSRNFGQQAALTAGLDAARGTGVVMMDADLQDPPEVIPKLVEKWRAGHDVVYMVREKRKEALPKRLAYALFYRTFRYLAEMDVPLDSGEFSLLDNRVVATLRDMPERARFLRGLRSWSGFRQASIRYERPPRPSGRSQYTWRRLLRLATDGLIGFSSAPLRLAALAGMVTALAGMAMMLFVVVSKLASASVPIGWTSGIAVVLLLGGVQLAAVGVLGAYIARIHIEVKNRPLYVVMERLG